MDSGVIKALNTLYNQEYGLQFEYSIDDNDTLVVNITSIEDLPFITKNILRSGISTNLIESLKYFPQNTHKNLNAKVMGSRIIFDGEEIDYNFKYESEDLISCITSFEETLVDPIVSNSSLYELRSPIAYDYTYHIQKSSDNDYYYVNVLMSPERMTFMYGIEQYYVDEKRIRDFCDNSEYAKQEGVTYEECASWFVRYYNNSALQGEQNITQSNQLFNCLDSIGIDSNNSNSLYYDYYFQIWFYITSIGNIEVNDPYEFYSSGTYSGIVQFIEYFN
jgi:hypothetical protein